QLAGMRRLPAMSVPCASQTSPAASAAAAPPDEPPQVRLVFHGLEVWPKIGFQVVASEPYSGVFERARTMPPRSSIRSTSGSDFGAMRSANTGQPKVLRTPSTSIRSLTAIGNPASQPG